MEIEPIGFFKSPFSSKFGIPRQSGIVPAIRGKIVLQGKYAQPEALRGLEQYDYVWLIWEFSEHVTTAKHPTVRPPLLGGNERVGVWATRSPFRPNNLGLSSVRLTKVDAQNACIEVLGADLMDGTPIYDIKPYLPYVDSHPEARGGFTDKHEWKRLEVVMPERMSALFDPEDLEVLKETLSLDPRPHYHNDDREYKMTYMGQELSFRVIGGQVVVQ